MTKKQDLSVAQLILGVTDEPYSSKRAAPVSKYHEVFVTLKPGQRIVCEEAFVVNIKNALGKWLHHQGHKGATARAKLRCADGKGGVWWIPAPPPTPATHWQAAFKLPGQSLHK